MQHWLTYLQRPQAAAAKASSAPATRPAIPSATRSAAPTTPLAAPSTVPSAGSSSVPGSVQHQVPRPEAPSVPAPRPAPRVLQPAPASVSVPMPPVAQMVPTTSHTQVGNSKTGLYDDTNYKKIPPEIARQARLVCVDRSNVFFTIPSLFLPQDIMATQVADAWSNMSPQARAEWGGNSIAFAFAVQRLTSLRRA